jgi:selenocysteine lyase/cysteine desulfurase
MNAWADRFRELFPVTKNWIYFNHAATAPYCSLTAEALSRYIEDFEQNGGVNYQEWEKIREETRVLAGRLIQSEPEEVALTANTSEGANIVAQGLDWKSGDNVVLPAQEFPANVFPWLNLRQKGVEPRIVPLSAGRLEVEDILGRVDGRTRVVAVSSVAFHNGHRLDLKTLGRELHARGVPLYVDAIQSLGYIPMDVKRCHISFLSADGHKWLLAPEGAALFFCAADMLERLDQAYLSWLSVREPFRFDDPRLELAPGARRFECGTPNVAGTVGLHASLKFLLDAGIERIEERVLQIVEAAAEGLAAKGYRILSPREEGERSGILTFDHPDHSAESLRDRLKDGGVVSTLRGGGVRISPHFYNNEEEIEQFLDILP